MTECNHMPDDSEVLSQLLSDIAAALIYSCGPAFVCWTLRDIFLSWAKAAQHSSCKERCDQWGLIAKRFNDLGDVIDRDLMEHVIDDCGQQ